jgi:ESCRT-I complex subunit VPS37
VCFFLDDSTFDTVFQTIAGDALILRVHLDAMATAPAMTLVGVRATHPWVDNRMRVVGCPTIQSDQAWQSSRMLLGAVVHEVVKHFQLQPPHLLEISDPGLRRLQQSNVGSSGGSGGSNTSHQPVPAQVLRDAPPDYESLFQVPEMPQVPTQFDNCLGNMSREDMQQLLDDDLDFLTFCTTLPAYQNIQTLGNSVMQENVVLAQANLEKEAQLKELHDQVTSLQSSLTTKIKTFDALEQEQNKLCAPYDTTQVLQKLSKAKKQAMDESEAYADEWVDEGGDVKEFVKVFVQKRKLHHVRSAKMERLKIS